MLHSQQGEVRFKEIAEWTWWKQLLQEANKQTNNNNQKRNEQREGVSNAFEIDLAS